MNQPPDRRVLLERYELGEIIGVGGMGEVRAARDLTLDRPVAIKFLRPHLGPTPDIRARFDTEAKAAARLNHPNIVGVFDSGEDDGVPFIVMERLSGRTLSDRLAEGPLTEWEARRLTLEILAALEASHEEGILHRDLKPGNVMLTEKGVAKVVDFGIAKAMEGLDITDGGRTLGTPGYLAPERIAGDPATPGSDVYSVGVMLYEMLTGKKPYEADTPIGLLRALQEDEPEPLAEARPGVDPVLAAIVERSFAKEPRRRYQSAGGMRQAMEEWLPQSEAEDTASLMGSPTSGLIVRRRGSSPARRRAAGLFIAILAIAWPAYILLSIGKGTPNQAIPSQSHSPPAAPSPTVPVDPAFQAALVELEKAVAETGDPENLEPAVIKIRMAAETGDRLGVSEQLVFMRNQVQARRGDELFEPMAERLLATIFAVDLQLGKIIPPVPLSPTPSPPVG